MQPVGRGVEAGPPRAASQPTQRRAQTGVGAREGGVSAEVVERNAKDLDEFMLAAMDDETEVCAAKADDGEDE